MPMMQAPVDIRIDVTPALGIKARLEQAVGVTIGERERRHRDRELDEVRDSNHRLTSENERLAQENEALREAAAIWIRLYERQLDRANRAAEMLAQCKEGTPR
jgi:hypothetical protein